MISPGRGASPPPDDDGHGGADDPAQEVVWKRPQPVEDVKAVKGEVDGGVFAGECAAPVPAALRYGQRLQTRPIFTPTVCHSRTNNRPQLPTTGGAGASAADHRPGCCDYCGGNRNQSRQSLRRRLVQHFHKGAAILGWSHNAPRQPRGCGETSSLCHSKTSTTPNKQTSHLNKINKTRNKTVNSPAGKSP